MNPKLMLVSVALGAALLAACDQNEKMAQNPKVDFSPSITQSTTSQPLPQPTPQVPSSTSAKSKDGKAPIQGQVDPREPAQRRDFEIKKP